MLTTLTTVPLRLPFKHIAASTQASLSVLFLPHIRLARASLCLLRGENLIKLVASHLHHRRRVSLRERNGIGDARVGRILPVLLSVSREL